MDTQPGPELTLDAQFRAWHAYNISVRRTGPGGSLLQDVIPTVGGFFLLHDLGQVALGGLGCTRRRRRRRHLHLERAVGPSPAQLAVALVQIRAKLQATFTSRSGSRRERYSPRDRSTLGCCCS
jgi:hypothetical protein